MQHNFPVSDTVQSPYSVHEEKLVKDTCNIQAEVLFTIVHNFIVRQKVTFDDFVLFLQCEPGQITLIYNP